MEEDINYIINMDYISTKNYNFGENTDKIIQICICVHKNLGPGWEEIFYQRALAKELGNNLKFAREVWIPVFYRGILLGRKRIDFIIENIMVEIKAKSEFDPQDYIQTLSYLRASNYKIGLLINFGSARIEIKRFVN